MESSQTEKKVSDVNESQRNKVHSLFKVPFLHKSETGADENDESRNFDTISQASSLRHAVSSRTDPFREGSKEGTGRKLLNMLRKTLKGSESKDLEDGQDIPSLVPFGDVVGCLAVHIKKCRHFSPRINLQYYTNLFIRITINKIMKCTKAHSVNFKNNEKKPTVKFEEVKYFSVQVPRRQDDERNMIYLELMEFDDLEAYPVLLGSFSLHLYEIIQKGCFTEEFYMKIRNLVICKVEVEFMFSYGNFGYGFSHQLKPLQKLIQPSMFMHIPPPVERTDPLTNVITPQLIEYPAFLSPDLNVTIGTQQKQTPLTSPVRLEKLQQQPRDRLDRMKKEYRSLKTWEEKSCYLDQILRMKAETKEFPDSKDTDDNEELFIKSEGPLPNLFEPPEFSFKKQEDKPHPSELPVKTPEVKKSLPQVEKKAEPPDSSLIIQEDAETKNESLPPEESTPLPPVSIKEKDICVDPIDGRDDQPVCEHTEPEGEMPEKEITESAPPEVKAKLSQMGSESMDSVQSETKLKSIILSPDRRKKSTDESGLETKRPMSRQETKRSSEVLQDLKVDSDTITKMPLPRHVSFSISHETIELPSNADGLNKDVIEEYASWDQNKDKDEEKEKYNEGVGEKNEIDEEDSEIIIGNTYVEDYSFRQAHPESMTLFQGCQKSTIVNRGKFEPFLRNITEIPIKEDDSKRIQNVSICTVVKKDTSSAEIIEHEDQDPPYPPTSSSLTVNSENSSWESNPDIFTIKSLDTEEIRRGLSSFSLESFEGESSFTIDIDLVGKGQENLLSELLDLNPSLEKLEKTVVLKSILNDDLKDLSEELFSKQGFLMEIEVERKSQSLLNFNDETLGSSENAQNKIKIVQSEQIELSAKKSSSSKSSKKDLKIVQSEKLSELSGKKSSSSKSSKNDLKIVQSEQLSDLSRKKSSSSKSSKNDFKIVQSEQLSELSAKKSSSSKSSKNDLKIVQSEQLSELSVKKSSSSKSSFKTDLKIVQSEHIELSGKTSSGSKSSKTDLKIVQSEHLGELAGKTSSGSKSSKSDLKIVQSEQIELSGKTSSSSKSSKNNLKVVQSEQIELSGKTSSGSKSSKSDLKILQSEHLIELSGKTSSGSKSSKNDLKIVKSEQLGELLGKISSGSKLSKIDLKIVQSEQIELSGKISSGSKSSKIELKTVQSEQLGELSRKTSSSSKSSFKNDLKIGQSEQLSEPSVKKSSSSKSSKNDLKILQSEQLGELSRKTSSSSKSSKNDLKIVQSEQIELSEKISSGSKSSKSDLKIVQSEQIELSGKISSGSKSSKIDLKTVQSEQLGELSRKTSTSSKSSKTDLKIMQSEQIELSGKISSGSKSSKNDLKIAKSEQLGELSGKASSGLKSSQNDLNIVQSEQLKELAGKESLASKSSQDDLKIVQSEQLIELSGKTSLGSKSSKDDLKIVQSEQIELSEKTSLGSKSSKDDLKIVQCEQIELSEKTSLGSKSSKDDLKIVQSEQIELSEKTSLGSKSSKDDLKIVQSEQIELSAKASLGSKSSKDDLKIVQCEQIELSEKTSLGSKSSKDDLKIVQSEQIELLEKASLGSKSSKDDLKIVQCEQIELSEKTSLGSKSSKDDLKIVQSEQIELLEKASLGSKSSKDDLKIVQCEQIELSEKTSLGSKSSKDDLKIVQCEQIELSEKTSLGSKSSKDDLKIVQCEQIELSEKTSLGSKSSKDNLKIVQSEQIELLAKAGLGSKSSKDDLKIVQSEQIELSEKTSLGSKSSKDDLKIVQSEQIELLAKAGLGSKSSKDDLKIVQSEQIELSEKTTLGSKSSKDDLKIVQSEQIELLGKASLGSKSSKDDLKIVQSEQIELSGKISSGSKSSKTDLKIVQNEQIELSENDLEIVQSEQIELSGKISSGSKSSKTDLKIVQSDQIELSGKISSGSKSSKTDLKIVQSDQIELSENANSECSSENDLKIEQNEETELSENENLSSKCSSENDLKIVQNEQIELSGKRSSSSKSSKKDIKIVQSEQNELSRKKSLSSKAFSKEVLKDNPTETPSESQIVGLTEEVEECHISQTFAEPEEQINIIEGDLSSGRKHSFKKKHPEEDFQKNSEDVISSISVLSIAESFESPEDVALIEQISSEQQITELDLEHSVSLLDFPESSITVWDSGIASTSKEPNESKHSGVDLSKSKSFVRHIFLQAFPSDSLESGIVSVIELDKEDYEGPWLETETSSSEERPTMMEEGWKLSLKNSKNQFPKHKEEDLPQAEHLYREKSFEEKDLSSVLENASTYIMHKLSDSDRTHLKSIVSNVFNSLSRENITELVLPSEAEVEKEKQTFFVPDAENEFEELDANSTHSMDKSDDYNVKPLASPKPSSFEEYLSGSEGEHLKADLGKHIQNFLVERLSESGPFPKEDLPKILESLYLINDKKEPPTSIKTEIPPKEQNTFKAFPETSPKSMPSGSTSNRPLFDDKHLEIRLRDLLSEILQQYILSNYAETKLIRERESKNREQNLPPYRTKTVPPFSHEVRHDYPERSFSGESELNRRGLLSHSLQDLLSVISENELLNLKSDLSKRLQSIFIERLSNMGLITEKEFHSINENLSLINSSDRPLKFLSSDLRGLSQFLERPSEKQSYKTFPRNMSQEVTDERLSNIELARKLEREYFTLHNIKRKSSLVREDERQYFRERVGKQGVKASRKSSQEFLFNNSSERITKLVLRREQKDHNLMQLPQVEKTGFEEEIQDLHGWYSRPRTNHSKATVKIKPLEKKEHINIYKVTVKEKPEPIVIPCVHNSEVQAEIKEYLYKSRLPSSSNTYVYLNSDDEEEPNLKDQCYGKSKENSKKKPLLTVTQFQKELQAVYVKSKETEKCTTTPQSFDHSRIVEINNSKPSIFPEVLKTEGLKPKLRREREYVEKQKRPLYRTAKILAASQPATRLLLRKSPQRTLLFPWAGKRNIHDSSESKKEDLHVTSFKHLEKAKARARLDLGKGPDDNQYTLKNLARPNTAPEFNKRLKESFGKFTSPRVVSAGLFHVNVTNPGLEEYNQKKDLKDLEKCSIICDILQLLNSSYVKRKYEDDY